MIIGFKTGPRNWESSKQIVLEDGARMCEVWFHVGKAEDYGEMFDWLKKHEVQIGLHHWGVVDGKIKTNLATQDEHVRNESLAQMKRTIEIGKEIGAVYVNVHPGARWLEKVDLDKGEQSLVLGSETPDEVSSRILLDTALELNEYSKTQEVLLTIETMLGREAKNYVKREGIYDSGTPSLTLMEKMAGRGIWIANDITHTAGSLATEDNSREGMWQGLRDFTQRAAAATRLVHINTVSPPFDGRDSHNGILNEDFAQNYFPSREQIIELLKIFLKQEQDARPRTEALASRTGVFAVPEPELEKTRANFLALKKIAEEAGVS